MAHDSDFLHSVVPESHNQDTVGCFARTVRDATYCLDGIYGLDPYDSTYGVTGYIICQTINP